MQDSVSWLDIEALIRKYKDLSENESARYVRAVDVVKDLSELRKENE